MPMQLCRVLQFAALVLASGQSLAATMFELAPFQTVTDIRAKWPGATLTRVELAWVKDGEVSMKMRGQGLPGELLVLFNDWRPTFTKMIAQNEADGVDPNLTVITARAEVRKGNDDSLTLEWFRWIPPAPIPMDRVIRMYGKPSVCKPSPADFSPICRWVAEGISITQSNDEKSAVLFDFQFSKSERRDGWTKRFPLLNNPYLSSP